MKKEQKQAILYVVLLTMIAPVAMGIGFFTIKVFEVLDFSFGASFLFWIPMLAYYTIVFGLGVRNVRNAVTLGLQGDIDACLKGMLIHKYGLVIFFLVNFALLFLLYMGGTLISLVATRGAALFMILPFLLPMVLFSVAVTWIIMLPGSIYGLQVVRISKKEGKLSGKSAAWNSLFQFIFLTDILSTMYLAVKKWDTGKHSSMIIALLYLIGLGLAAYAITKLVVVF